MNSLRQRMEDVWRKRAQRLSRRPVVIEAGQNALPVIVLGIGKERYGIDISDVAEVLPPVRATPVPGANTSFRGVINVHGEIRPVIDLRRLLRMEAIDNVGLARVVLLRLEGREIGLQVDSVEEIRWIGPTDLRAGGHTGSSSLYVKGATRDLLMLLNTSALFAELPEGATT